MGLVLGPVPAAPPPPPPTTDPSELCRFAADYELDLEAIAHQLQADPGYQTLSPTEQHQALTRALMGAAAERELQEQAAS